MKDNECFYSVSRKVIVLIAIFGMMACHNSAYSQHSTQNQQALNSSKKEIAATLWFNNDSKSFRNFYKEMLEAVIRKYQNTNGSDKITLEGSFVAGTKSEIRAAQMDAVFDYLVSKGVPKWKISTRLKNGGKWDDNKWYNVIKVSFPDNETIEK